MTDAPDGRSPLRVRCPDCGCALLVDRDTGALLEHVSRQSKPAGGRSLEDLMGEAERQKAAAEARFDQESRALEDQDRVLEEKFRRALERAESEPGDERPERPFDFD